MVMFALSAFVVVYSVLVFFFFERCSDTRIVCPY